MEGLKVYTAMCNSYTALEGGHSCPPISETLNDTSSRQEQYVRKHDTGAVRHPRLTAKYVFSHQVRTPDGKHSFILGRTGMSALHVEYIKY